MKSIDLNKEIRENKKVQESILPVMYSYKERRDKVLSEENKEKFTCELKKIKEEAIENITNLKEQTITNLVKNGVKVFEAKNSNEANKRILEIIGKEKLIVKAKSNTFKEICLDDFLKDKNVVDTDLGDFIVKIFNEKDLHPVFPAVNFSEKEISLKIKQKFKKNVKATPEDIATFARDYLREKIFKAKVGITGANVISSDGSIFILENEGNISLVSRIPDKHIIVAGFDKIVKTREDALKIVKAAGVFGTGQDYPVYVNIISGPSKTADIQNKLVVGAQGAKEVYLILLDNKRNDILNSEFKSLLNCINCGACVNFCPVYHQIFRRYGTESFPGAKGVLSSYFGEGAKESYENGAFFCTTCRACSENCPMEIDLSGMMKELRKKLVKRGVEPPSVSEMIINIKNFGNPFGNLSGKSIDRLYCC